MTRGILSLGVLAVAVVGAVQTIPTNSPRERTIMITVTAESLERGVEFCHRVERAGGGTLGFVALYDRVGAHYAVPCSAVRRER